MQNLRFILIALLLSGCAAGNVSSDYSPAKRLGKGALVMSMTYTPDAPTFTLLYRPVGTNGVEAFLSNTVPHPEDWKNPAGRLVVSELPAGNYEIFRYVGGWYESKKPFSIPFTVVEGKAVYIGNIHVDEMRTAGTFRISVTDRSDRDIPFLRARYKNVKESDIVKNMSTVRWD